MALPESFIDRDPFRGGPLRGLERKLGLVPGNSRVHFRVVLVAAAAWLPLCALSSAQTIVGHHSDFASFARDIGAHARYLVAAPLLVLGEMYCFPRLSRIVNHFVESGIVRQEQGERVRDDLRAAERMANSATAGLLIVLSAYAAAIMICAKLPLANLPGWIVGGGPLGLSPAGAWHAIVSLPLLFMLLFRWIWRQAVWCLLMRRISRLDLELTAAHPDRAGGLNFLGGAIRGYRPLALAFGSIAAGSVANQLQNGFTSSEALYVIFGVVAVVLAIFLTPFSVFIPVLRKLRETGNRSYGTLAGAIGREFENKWLGRPTGLMQDCLEKQDFSAANDLFQILRNVQQVRVFPIPLGRFRELVVFTLIPFIPILLLLIPLDVLLPRVLKLFI